MVRPRGRADGSTGPPGKVEASRAQKDDFQWKVHGYVNEYIRYADTKAALVIAYASAMVGVLYGKGLHKAFANHAVAQWNAGGYISAAAFAVLAISIMLAAYSIVPRLHSHGKAGFIFWDDICRHKGSANYASRLDSMCEDMRSSELSDHVFLLACVAKRKFRVVGWSFWTALAGSAAGAFLLIFRT